MIRIYRKLGSEMRDRITTTAPVEAEAAYLQLIQHRATEPGTVVVHPQPGEALVVPSARYRTDRDWPAGIPREQEQERCRIQWAAGPPTCWMIRAVAHLLGVTGAQAAAIVGVDSRTWRRWTAEPDVSSARAMPLSAYHHLLVLAGWHPELGDLSDRERRERTRRESA